MASFHEQIILTSESATYIIADRSVEIPVNCAERLARLFGIQLVNIRDARLIIVG